MDGSSENDVPPPCTRKGAGGGLELLASNIYISAEIRVENVSDMSTKDLQLRFVHT